VEVLKMLPKQSNHGFPETGKENNGKKVQWETISLRLFCW
jgi:hypothetical protein